MEKTEKLCDLHTHSHYSDGTDSPYQIIERAEETGLDAVALTDHNCVDGLCELVSAAQGRNIEAIPGIEFSTDYFDRELHIVALYVSSEYFDEIRALTMKPQEDKERSNIELVSALGKVGIEIDYEKMKAESPDGKINRAHFAAEIVRLGFAKTRNEAFLKYLDPSLGLYRPPMRLDAFETIEFIKSIGAVSILAHPFLQMNRSELRAFLAEAKERGLDGIETHYSEFSPVQTEWAIEAAEEFGLLKSGGSDYHGGNKPNISLGRGVGSLKVPYRFVDEIKVRGTVKKAHSFCARHRSELEKDNICGCFYCLRIYSPKEIAKWLPEGSGTALCPYCGIDSVIGESSGHPITDEFLEAMKKYWFER